MIIEYNQDTIELSPFTALLVNQHINKHSHYFWEFTYCLNGEIQNIVNETPIKTHALRELILIKPGDTHEIIKEKSTTNTEYHRDIYVTREKMKRICDFLDPSLFDTLTSSNTPIIIDCKNEGLEALEHSLNLFKINASYSSENMFFLEQLHSTIIFQLLGFYIKNQHENKEPYPEWIEDFLASLKSEAFLCQDIEKIIKKYNYSHGHICREFKKYVGKPMVQCLNESRIIYSTILLMDNSLSILDIAMRLNFSSQSAYINAFKKIYEVSPNKWRIHKL